jgi:nucleotide-binding universal stress UspA family protein
LAAGDLARGLNVGVHVVHSWMPLNTAFGPAGAPLADIESVYAEPAAEVLHAQVAALRRDGVAVAGEHLLMGVAAEEIAGLATTIGAQLVVTGSRGLGLIKRLALGSVSEGVVNHSTAPVLVVRRGDEAWPPDRVLVGYDGSESSRGAAACAAVIGKATGAEVTLAIVINPYALAATVPTETMHAGETLVRRMADELAEVYEISIKTTVLSGESAPALVSLAEDCAPALLAVGSRGEGSLRRLALGSVSMAVLHGAQGPVLIAHSAA